MNRVALVGLMLAGMTFAKPTIAAEAGRNDRAALLFAYHISDAAKFDAAYRAHLEWHRAHQDHLAWYGWYVIAGARTGMFVDGTFGSDFAAIDRRPALAEDAADFAGGAAQHSTVALYNAWALWPQPSTDFSLEDQQPSPMLDVLFVTPKSGAARAFEEALGKAARRDSASPLDWTWYRAAAGDVMPSYMVLMPRRSWAELSGRPRSVGQLASAALGLNAADADRIDSLVERATAETWRYRADLSLMPPKE
jgi:hypothetical protein